MNLVIWLASIAGGLTSLSIIYRLGLAPMGRGLRGAWRSIKQIDEQTATLSQIAQEFRPNHGSSLKDHITSLNGKIDHVTIKQAEDHERFTHFEAYARNRMTTIADSLQTLHIAIAGTTVALPDYRDPAL